MNRRAPVDSQAESKAVPWTQKFRRNSPSVLPTREQLRRQDSVLRCAWRSLGESGPVIAFLNTHNEELGGQPLFLALESDEGLLRVEGLLGEIVLRNVARPT
jgi:hypothetical protein